MKHWILTTAGMSLTLFAALPATRADAPVAGRVGALEYIEGAAFVDGQPTSGNRDKLPILDNGQSLSTEDGHAEMILTPGVFLRLGSHSEVQLLNASLTDTRLRLDQGSAMLEVDNLHRDNLIRMETGDGTVRILKNGLYRFDANPAEIQVLQGKVEATTQESAVNAGKHREVALESRLAVSKFKPAPDDDLSRWSRLRSEYEAEASISSAQYFLDTGWPGAYADWFWNPWFSTWSWFPASGLCWNPYGFGLFSPWMVYQYYPVRYYGLHHYGFVHRTGPVSPSGLNLQRGAAIHAAQFGAPGRFGGGGGYGGPRASAGRMGMGRPMGHISMGHR